MTPKEKANELFDSFFVFGIENYPEHIAVQSSKITVKQIILYFTEEIMRPMQDHIDYWNEVLKEIDEL